MKLKHDGVSQLLLFEEVFEGLAGVVGARRRWRRGPGGLRIGSRRGIFFDGHAKFVKGAGVLDVLGRNAFGDRLGALESGSGIEKAALLATVELELALGTLAIGIKPGREDRTTVGAPGARDRADHAWRARAELIGATRPSGRWLFFV